MQIAESSVIEAPGTPVEGEEAGSAPPLLEPPILSPPQAFPSPSLLPSPSFRRASEKSISSRSPLLNRLPSGMRARTKPYFLAAAKLPFI